MAEVDQVRVDTGSSFARRNRFGKNQLVARKWKTSISQASDGRPDENEMGARGRHMSSVSRTEPMSCQRLKKSSLLSTKPVSCRGRKESSLLRTKPMSVKQRECWRPEEPRPKQTIEICYAFIFHGRKDLGISPFEQTRGFGENKIAWHRR